MLIALGLSALLQGPPAQDANAISHRPALPALAAKAPGRPEYGLHITSPQGQFIFTNLRYSPLQTTSNATLYRVKGPAGWGPYRLGLGLDGISHWVRPDLKAKYDGSFFDIQKAIEGGAAKEAGLDEDWCILSVDGQNFGWNADALSTYWTTRPSIEVLALKRKGWGMGVRRKTFQLQLQQVDKPADPTDAELVPEAPKELKPYIDKADIWVHLIKSRSELPRFRALPVELQGETLWVVRGVPPGSIILEFWKGDPRWGSRQLHPEALWAEPEDGLVSGRILKVREQWYRIQDVEVEARSGRLLKLALQPWTTDVPGLLAGADLSRYLGPKAAIAHREFLEELANDALLEWKTRTLPGLLSTQGLGSTEDMVIRLERGILKLDLEVKGIRSRLDARARAETEQKAQAELAAKNGAPPPQAQVPPASESERLADLLEQRKAILTAILGSAKQSLANLRR